MAIRDLVPRFGKDRDRLPARRAEDDPFREFQRQMNRLFDDFFGDFGLAPRWEDRDLAPVSFTPRVDVTETDKEVRISAELPGMDEKDISVEMDNASVTIRGEKKQEQEEKGRNWYRREQSFGSFCRVVPLPAGVEGDKAKAKFKKGVLTLSVPRSKEAAEQRREVAIESD